MGIFSVPIEIGDQRGEQWERVEALVDTGASYSQMPGDLLARLGIQPDSREEFVTADGSVVTRALGEVATRINGRTRHTVVLFGDPGMPALLGAYTLEGFGLAVDPVRRQLVPARLYLV